MKRLVMSLVMAAMLVQAFLAARAEIRALARLPRTLASFGEDSFPTVYDRAHAQAYRRLREVAQHVEQPARVLVLTDIIPNVAFDFYLLPSRVLVLQKFEPSILSAPSLDEGDREMARMRFEGLEEGGRRFTPERLQAAMQRCDYVLVYGGVFDLSTYPLEEVMRGSPEVVLYRRRH
ncbi:MAG: hypothetical protein U1E76_22080 [Planctomycetota bacterium]